MKGRSQPYKTLLSTPGVSYCGLTIFPLFKVIFLVIVPYFCLDSMLFLLGRCYRTRNYLYIQYLQNVKYHLYIKYS